VGTAEKEGESVAFNIGFERGYNNLCGEFVGDARKGIVSAGGAADLELTFHFDHIFGDAELPADDSLNELAPGFAPFASQATNGVVETDLATLEDALTAGEYEMIVDILPTLGHTGEGHCLYTDLGTLEFRANGEDFVRQGFTSKDGWAISFEHVYVTVSDITAYQTDPPYEPEEGVVLNATTVVEVPGVYTIDLAAGDDDAEPIFVAEAAVPAGQYNALSWDTVPAVDGEAAGYTVLLVGTAEKEGESVAFNIGFERGYNNLCGEFVGDARKGILSAGGQADLELTFHFDHIFGDGELPADDSLNELAPGFAPFASLAADGVVETDLTALEEGLTAGEYEMIVDILPTLGHTGEGHCLYTDLGTLEFRANGEDFVRQGFTSKDGWAISFEHVYVTVSDITAYQTNPPYEPGEGGLRPIAAAGLPGPYTIDLAEGADDAEPIFIDQLFPPAGQYNALAWDTVPATDGEAAGYAVLMQGTAEKEGESIAFSIGVENSYNNLCGEFVGDARKGILSAGGLADLELTFHFDHIFGDAELPADDGLNELAPGFAPFASMAEDGVVETDLTALEEALTTDEYQMIVDILPTLGHTGEGHCLYDPTGTLEFRANGEDFVRQGFTSKDGWAISFDHVYVNLTDITAYQTDPPYEPDAGDEIEAETTVMLAGPYLVDLAAGADDAEPILVDHLIAPSGQYNALAWQMVPASEGETAGYAVLMQGTAEKEGESLEFTIGVENSYSNLCGEFVGDARKGILRPDGAADLELTFHFDHIFGDADLPADDSLNELAPGFEPFASQATNGLIETDLATLEEALTADEYEMLVEILPTLGHTGEGHCYYGLE
ncbi:MAG: hypothetical protein KDF65_14520, partial [Anaerolineae bacterium]|nr:hypothetical protein [Anaerolineae bacterium]